MLAAGAMVSQAACGLDRIEAAAGPGVVFAAKACGAGETLFKAIRTTRIGGGVRVDYQVVETGAARWANMNAALLRKFQIRVGARFCMPLDSGDAAQSTLDYD